MLLKTFPGELKLDEAQEGRFRATISIYHVVDKDGDVTLPGALRAGQPVAVASFGHDWAKLPIGRAVIGSDASRAWVDGELFLDTAAGREHHAVLRKMGQKQQWSYGYSVLKSHPGTLGGRPVRFLEALDVHECSPVMLGAGGPAVNTEWVKGGAPTAGQRVYEIYRAGQIRRLRQELDILGREAVAAAGREFDLRRFAHDELMRRASLLV